MRDVTHIWEGWQSTDPKVGDYRANTVVTVEKDFWLRLASTAVTNPNGKIINNGRNLGQWKRGPARWFQRADDSQEETIVPNVRSVDIDRSVDADAGTCTIVISNQKMLTPGEPQEVEGQLGRSGFYTPGRGSSQEAKARWGHAPNEWSGVFVPNALMRTYQGYGGHEKTLDEAIADGNLVLTGVWLVDEVTPNAKGQLNLRCRDMAKLLLDQPLYPPLVPDSLYPLKYMRYTFERYEIPPAKKPSASEESIVVPTIYEDGVGFTVSSSSDIAAGSTDASIHGHRPTDILDWSFDDPPGAGPGEIAHQDTYWLSEDHAGRNEYAWIEFRTEGRDINKLYIHAWAGNYRMFVSVREHGHWVGAEGGGEGGFVNGAPYVKQSGVPYESLLVLELPRTYRAEKIRLTFTNLQLSQQGGYRAGLRKAIPLFDQTLAEYPPYVFAGCGYPKIMGENHDGYWQARSDGRVFAFGDARTASAGSTNPVKKHTNPIMAINCNGDGTGYWTMDTHGRIVAYGTAEHFGDLYSVGRADAVDFTPTASGDGYWILCADGDIFEYGDASSHGDASPSGSLPSGADVIARRIEGLPSADGFWVLHTDGTVEEFGAATNYGSANRTGFDDTEYVACIRRTSTGLGYWIVSGGGIVQAFGDAWPHGNGHRYSEDKWSAGLCWDLLVNNDTNGGYGVQHADGRIDKVGSDWLYFGSIGEGSGLLRKDGNYKDYSDVIKELLLWAGFYLYRDPQPASFPDVYGNIESTGAYSEEALPQEMFDKVPVMQAITALKESVGYIFTIDQEGGARFQSPNWWGLGNYDYEGNVFDFMPEVDERIQLTDYQYSQKDADARSEITISSSDPRADRQRALVTTIQAQGASDLKGLVKPALWWNGVFTSKEEQEVMAHLVNMHLWFARRQGNVTCHANPLIDVDDQVRIYERQTSETNIHYVRGVATRHDLVSGEYTMTLTTNWLGGSPWLDNALFLACALHPGENGYWQVNTHGEIFAFGDAELFEKNIVDSHLEKVVAMHPSSTGDGYWTMDLTGKILSYGDAEHYGDLSRIEHDVADFAVTPAGDGYWIVRADGTVEVFGAATHHGNGSPTGSLPSGDAVTVTGIEAHIDDGYWLLWSDGTVEAFGTATHYGDANRTGFDFTEYVHCIRSSASGDGYIVVSGGGIVQAFGDAVDHGDAVRFEPMFWVYGLCWDAMVDSSDEYSIQHAVGTFDASSSFPDLGGVGDSVILEGVDWVVRTESTEPILHAEQQDHVVVPDPVVSFLERTGSRAATAVKQVPGHMTTTKATS